MRVNYWVTRDKNSLVKSNDDYITLWSEKPFNSFYEDYNRAQYYSIDNTPSFLCQHISIFKKNFGFVPEKGECKEVIMECVLIQKE